MLNFLADDPRRHRVYIEASHVAADAVGLEQGGAPPMNGSATLRPEKSLPVK